MNYKNIIFEQKKNIGIVTINRQEVLNALNHETLSELMDAFHKIEDNPDIRAFIITGSGPKAFVAGADINELNGTSPINGLQFMHFGQRIFNFIEEMGTPSIAAVNGYALGGGCELAMACDLRVASVNAKFGQPEIKLGNIPGWGGTQRLPRLIGKSKAKELIFTGIFITAEEAEKLGLVNKVVSQEDLLNVAEELAYKIALMSPIALKLAKSAINKGYETDIKIGLELEAQGVALCFTTDDQKEGVKAFFEKRPPVFMGK
ncbi:crotonase [Biomaibacter acetigenes]|jgi:enoyl-CoA hydratase|uniref:short-chain-enoyl-CoA hydratase n=1 Tax=Biomaibacter acetigenes TaxID=2316383 RepID=A0A3G2R2I1_9FIRM|nr:enoyl-CoA hydratase-related protein [Biomaibacter acetigenes]AYO29650.1 crotonase [Biomaibacter acetigenes]MDK2799297.1 enoyl-CoA hydratase [Clostridiales bacterium]RKL63629.1 crotonase [Thermoanaerobacteraceae bacterium SP2]